MTQKERDLPRVAGGADVATSFAGRDDLPASLADLHPSGWLLALLTLEAAAFALAEASGKMPEVVIRLFRALLTL